MAARDYDRHTVAVEYRTERMADADYRRLPQYGWTTRRTDDPKVLHVDTYKPLSLFGDHGQELRKRPSDDAPYQVRACWEHGVVGWTFACGCTPEMLESDRTLNGVQAMLQPRGQNGGIYFPAAEYIIERVDWPCFARDNRASVSVRAPDEEHWRGRTVMVSVEDLFELRQAAEESGEHDFSCGHACANCGVDEASSFGNSRCEGMTA